MRPLSNRLLLALAWLAIVGMAMASVAPGVTRLRGEDPLAAMSELCSTKSGLASAIALGASTRLSLLLPGDAHLRADGSEAPASIAGSDDCPYCTLHPPAVPASAVRMLPAAGSARLVPQPYLSDAVTRHAWRTAQPRGPPAA